MAKTSKKKGSTSSAPRAPRKAHNALSRPALKKGEVYVGAIINAAGKGHHVILLEGDVQKNHADAMAWAKEQGGDLPDRVEQALLFRDHRDEFKRDWYWSNTPYERDSGCAWYQGFDYGYQSASTVSYASRARAVRRVPIQ